MLRKILLVCGILSSLLYVGIDALAVLQYGNYHSYTSQAISEERGWCSDEGARRSALYRV
jgi:hypothetical protein